jgi:Ca2+:H+ antiporter
MSLNFELFDAVVLILAILVVGQFLRDGKSNYLEGVLCFFVYVLIAVAAFYYPNPVEGQETAGSSGSGE